MKKIEKLYSAYKQTSGVSTDSRKIIKGCIFFALKGPNFDGNKFAQSALDKGAKYVVVDDEGYINKNFNHSGSGPHAESRRRRPTIQR